MKKENFQFMDIKFVKGVITATYEDTDNGIITKKCSTYPHDDLVLALKAFDQKLREVFLIPKNYQHHVKANGISLRFKGITPIVCIKGLIASKSGANLSLVTDYISPEDEGYGFEKDINKMITALSDEVFAYVTNKKKGETSQLDEFMDNKNINE